MNATNFQKLLGDLQACGSAREWAEGKSWEEVYTTCHRGDWLLWLFKKTNPLKIREITLAKAYCARLTQSWMKDQRSISAIDVAIRFGQGEATKDELNAAYAAAYDAAYAATDAAAYAAYAAYAAADADAAAYADAAANAAYAAAYAADAAAYVVVAATAAANAAYAATYAATATAAANAADAAAYAARKESLQKSADICRQYLPIEIWGL